ncbi:hypothetical protein BT69DRAFT_1298412 [Atractiella rhizophila]|nr:hypothetical protein BT69DRAFT_1298412 [Atractiella rhizophila]
MASFLKLSTLAFVATRVFSSPTPVVVERALDLGLDLGGVGDLLKGTTDGLLNALNPSTYGLEDGICAFVHVSPLKVDLLGSTLLKLGQTDICVCALNSNGGVKCECDDGYRLVNGVCVEIPTCGANSDVKLVNGVLKCICKAGYELTGHNVCSPTCGDHADRVNGKCVCKKGYKMAGTNCLPVPASCPSHSHVSLSHGEWTCVCDDGYKMLDGTCKPTPNCPSGQSLKAVNGQWHCVCPSSSEVVNGQCRPKCGTNEVRNSKGQCVCRPDCGTLNGKCVSCPSTHYLSGGNTCKDGIVVKIGGTCVLGVDLDALGIDFDL